MAPLTVLTWNLFHGRDHPLDGSDEHASVNRPLRDEFAATLAREPWDVALLQEAPPHWLRALAQAAGASGASVLTSRNIGAFVRRRLAEWNPDLIKSGEGGSNQILVRSGWRIAETRRLTLTLLPERRRLIWARLAHPEHGALTVATLHATAHEPAAAARDVERAARAACAWSAEMPLVFGGDLNLRMAELPDAFERLRRTTRPAGCADGAGDRPPAGARAPNADGTGAAAGRATGGPRSGRPARAAVRPRTRGRDLRHRIRTESEPRRMMAQAKKSTSKKSSAKKSGSQEEVELRRRSRPRRRRAPRSPRLAVRSDFSGKSVADFRKALTERLVEPLNLVMLTRDRIEETVEEAVSRGSMTRDAAQDLDQPGSSSVAAGRRPMS